MSVIHFGSSFAFNIRNSISKNVLIFGSCTSFTIISRTTSDPFCIFEDSSLAYSIQTQFAQPDMQQLFGGVGIYLANWNENSCIQCILCMCVCVYLIGILPLDCRHRSFLPSMLTNCLYLFCHHHYHHLLHDSMNDREKIAWPVCELICC